MSRNNDNPIDKSDLDTIIEVNRKAIELHTEVAGQNEELLENIETFKEDIEEKLDTVLTEVKDVGKTQTKIYIILASGVITVILQVVQLIWGKH